eukprot:16435612-Heterocapsa_arctica.AAC.1
MESLSKPGRRCPATSNPIPEASLASLMICDCFSGKRFLPPPKFAGPSCPWGCPSCWSCQVSQRCPEVELWPRLCLSPWSTM